MIVIQRCHFQRALFLEPMPANGGERAEASAIPQLPDSEMLSITGRDLRGHEIAWVICHQHIRSLSFPLKKIVVPSESIEKFLISGNSPQVFTVWLRATRAIPTRVRPPRGQQKVLSGKGSEATSSSDASFRIPVGNMELGTVFGTVPLERMTAGLNRLGYQVQQCSWEELLADSQR
jgi:hypothetical protein